MRRLLCFWYAGFLFAQSVSLLEQADAAFRSGDLARAAALARQALARNPGTPHAHLILGIIAAQAEDWTAAEKHFQAVIRLDPADPHGYFYLGQARLYQHRWEQAIPYFSKALERQYPDGPRLIIAMALAQNEAGRPKQALDLLQKLSPPPDGPLAAQYHSVLALALGKLNRPIPAIESMRRALRLDDSKIEYWEFLITTLFDTDQTPAALAEAIRAQKKFPDHPDIQYLFGLASYYVSESPLTGLALRNLREADPESPRVALVEGFLHRKQGRNDQAVPAFRRAAEQGLPDAHLLLGIIAKENGDYETAEREYREAERLNPANGQVLLELGKLLLAGGDLQQAQSRLEKALELLPSHSGLHYQLGLLYGRLGLKEKAAQHLNESQRLAQALAEAAGGVR